MKKNKNERIPFDEAQKLPRRKLAETKLYECGLELSFLVLSYAYERFFFFVLFFAQ